LHDYPPVRIDPSLAATVLMRFVNVNFGLTFHAATQTTFVTVGRHVIPAHQSRSTRQARSKASRAQAQVFVTKCTQTTNKEQAARSEQYLLARQEISSQ
jgi:hypothetical protein